MYIFIIVCVDLKSSAPAGMSNTSIWKWKTDNVERVLTSINFVFLKMHFTHPDCVFLDVFSQDIINLPILGNSIKEVSPPLFLFFWWNFKNSKFIANTIYFRFIITAFPTKGNATICPRHQQNSEINNKLHTYLLQNTLVLFTYDDWIILSN